MLDPETRSHTLEILRPPQGYELDRAIATTFSLDLLALLTAPLAFTLFDWEDEVGRTTNDPLAILESLRRYADRISIFCQAGRIAVPKTHQLFSYLEDSIFQVTARRPGVCVSSEVVGAPLLLCRRTGPLSSAFANKEPNLRTLLGHGIDLRRSGRGTPKGIRGKSSISRSHSQATRLVPNPTA